MSALRIGKFKPVPKAALVAVCAAFGAAWAHGQTLPGAETLIDRYIEASGGREAHESVKSRATLGTLSIPAMKFKGAFEFYQQPPNSRHTLEIEGSGSVVTGVIEEGAWRTSLFEGPYVMEGSEEFDARQHGALNGLLSWRERFRSGRALREDAVNGEPAYVVRLVSPEGGATEFYFSKETSLLVKIDRSRETLLLSDYKEVDGVLLPHKIVSERGPIPVLFELTVESIEHNRPIPESTFDVPKEVLAAASAEGSSTKEE